MKNTACITCWHMQLTAPLNAAWLFSSESTALAGTLDILALQVRHLAGAFAQTVN